MTDFVVGLSDGYHSVAFADGLEPADRRPFSIAAPVSLPSLPREATIRTDALAEIPRGALADRNA
ncbi:hypothetical protein [Solidesulfovibrio sp. C21]|uniref:hypothetical protein n=1 Tax=Solidesulfovibrio sp. C21 TaxID=3398613 RepID=UPI0039FC4884